MGYFQTPHATTSAYYLVLISTKIHSQRVSLPYICILPYPHDFLDPTVLF